MVVDGLRDEVGHDFCDGGVVLTAAVEDVLHDLVELVHLNSYIKLHYRPTDPP